MKTITNNNNLWWVFMVERAYEWITECMGAKIYFFLPHSHRQLVRFSSRSTAAYNVGSSI